MLNSSSADKAMEEGEAGIRPTSISNSPTITDNSEPDGPFDTAECSHDTEKHLQDDSGGGTVKWLSL